MNTHKCAQSIQCLKIQSHVWPTQNRADHLLPPIHQQLCVHQEHTEVSIEIEAVLISKSQSLNFVNAAGIQTL